jgi:hypothetical protein
VLVEKKDLHRLHIVLDASKAHRCNWCGTPQSDRWLTRKTGVYCSKKCVRAAASEARLCYLPLPILYIMLVIWIWPELGRYLAWLFLLLFIPPFAIPILFFRDRKFALEIPKGSRSHIGVSEVSLLRKLSAPIECPNCDANIDLSKISEDMIYTCQYCGATGVVEIDILEKIQVTETISRFKM